MKRNFGMFLQDILAACDDIQDFVQGMDQATFLEDKKTASAVVRQFEIIGEAAKNVPDSIKQKHPNIPWKDIAGMRDRLIQGYFRVDCHLVRDTIAAKVPELKESIQKVLDDLAEDE